MVFVLLRLPALLVLLLLFVLFQTWLQLCFLLVPGGAVQTSVFTDAAVRKAVVVLAHG